MELTGKHYRTNMIKYFKISAKKSSLAFWMYLGVLPLQVVTTENIRFWYFSFYDMLCRRCGSHDLLGFLSKDIYAVTWFSACYVVSNIDSNLPVLCSHCLLSLSYHENANNPSCFLMLIWNVCVCLTAILCVCCMFCAKLIKLLLSVLSNICSVMKFNIVLPVQLCD